MDRGLVVFGFKNINQHDLKGEAVLDCRVIRNPYYRGITFEEAEALIRSAPEFQRVVDIGLEMMEYNSFIYVGCSYGKHRSVVVAKEMIKHCPMICRVRRFDSKEFIKIDQFK